MIPFCFKFLLTCTLFPVLLLTIFHPIGLGYLAIHMTAVRPNLIAKFMESTWSPSGADRTQMGPMLAPWTLLLGKSNQMLEPDLIRTHCRLRFGSLGISGYARIVSFTSGADIVVMMYIFSVYISLKHKVYGVNMGLIWGRQDQMGPMLSPWILLPGE